MVVEEVYIDLRLDAIPPLTQVGVVDCWVPMFLLVLYRPAILPTIILVENTVP